MRESLCAVLAVTVLATSGCGSYTSGQAQAAPQTSTASDDPTNSAITRIPVVISGGTTPTRATMGGRSSWSQAV